MLLDFVRKYAAGLSLGFFFLYQEELHLIFLNMTQRLTV